MIVVKDDNDEVIAFHYEPDPVYNYMNILYKIRPGKYNVSSVPDEIMNELIISDNSEKELVLFYDDIYLPLWDYYVWYNYFVNWFETGRESAFKYAEHMLNRKSSDMNIHDFLRMRFKDKYKMILSYDLFMKTIGSDKILEIIIDGDTDSKYIYDLDSSYKSKISDDK